MSNSTYCDDHYEQPWWSKELQEKRDEIRRLKNDRDQAQEKLKRMEKLGQAMYFAAQRLNSDASHLKKAMEDWHQFIINEL